MKNQMYSPHHLVRLAMGDGRTDEIYNKETGRQVTVRVIDHCYPAFCGEYKLEYKRGYTRGKRNELRPTWQMPMDTELFRQFGEQLRQYAENNNLGFRKVALM